MAIVKIKASKATPEKAIAYVTDENKAGAVRTRWLDPSRDFAEQFREEAIMWGKPWRPDDRKYYHLKLSFHPSDWVKNGGTLSEDEALDIGMGLVIEFFREHSSVLATHTDTEYLHVHGIINAVSLTNGSMIDMRNELYRKFKDRVQEICEERGLHALDWREATIEARARERQNGAPISESFAELGLRNRGEVVWKDELRAVIDDAATTCTSMEEFTEQLLVNGVVITRITNRTISYKLRNYRVCRGDGLGADYTLEAIRHALAHNVEPVEDQDYVNLDDRIDDAEIFGEKKRKKISLEERQAYRAIGRDAFMSRMEIDEICDFADRATWNEKQEFWTKAQKIKEDFWNQWRAKRDYLEKERKMLLSGLRSAKQLRWLFDPRNRRAGLFSVVVGMIVFRDVGDPEQYRKKLAKVNESIKALKDVGDAFRTASARTTDILRVNGYSIEKYTKAVKALQDAADGLDKKKETADDETVKLVRRVAREMELARELERCEKRVKEAQADFKYSSRENAEEALEELERAKEALVDIKETLAAHRTFRSWELDQQARAARDARMAAREVQKANDAAEEAARRKRTADHESGFAEIFSTK